MFTKKLTDLFSADLLDTVRGVLGEAKKCPADCECEKCEKEETKEGYVPTADEPTEANKKTADKVRALLAKEKKPVKEESEQIDEISKDTMGRYINKAKNSIDLTAWRQGYKEAGAGNPSKQLEKKLSKRHKGIETAVNKLTKEDAEQIDETGKQHIEVTHVTGQKSKKPVSADNAFKALNHYKSLSTTKSARIVSEDAEQIDELSKGTMGRYINKAATKMGSQGVTAGLKIAADEKSSKNFKDMAKREKGIKLAVGKLTKEDAEQVDEGSYKDNPRHMGTIGPITTDAERRERAKKYREKLTKEEQDFIDALNNDTLEEARGRPKKAGGKDFTIHPKTKEKLMHNNPEHMKKIERLQKFGVLEKPKTEASQHIMNQLSKAKTSMTGGATIHFTHGDSKHVSGTHAAKLIAKYQDMKPHEKEDFQKKIGHSHEQLMKHV